MRRARARDCVSLSRPAQGPFRRRHVSLRLQSVQVSGSHVLLLEPVRAAGARRGRRCHGRAASATRCPALGGAVYRRRGRTRPRGPHCAARRTGDGLGVVLELFLLVQFVQWL